MHDLQSPCTPGLLTGWSRVQELVDAYGLGDYVSYDLGMLSKYSYYTGIIFKAYTYGTGEYIVTGGRYDRLLEQFGKKAPAVGFAIVVDQLMLALSPQQNPGSRFFRLYGPGLRARDGNGSHHHGRSLRSQGETFADGVPERRKNGGSL